MRKLRVFLIDPAHFHASAALWLGIPINIGFLAAYAESVFGDDVDIQVFRDPRELLEAACVAVPDVVGLSRTVWNRNLTLFTVKKIKEIAPNCLIVVGGPEVDDFPDVQKEVFKSYAGECDFLVPNEGEIGFANILETLVANGPEHVFDDPIDNAIFMEGESVTPGFLMDSVGSIDLEKLPSPILSGKLDKFMTPTFRPLLQTTRLCPYQCTFCVSGRRTGKLNAFSPDRVEAEVEYYARHYRELPHIHLWLSDDNFGINAQDVDVAWRIRGVAERDNWPKGVSFYVDKKFTARNREVFEILATTSLRNFPVSLQSNNEQTLEAVKRKNIKTENIDKILDWAKTKGFNVSSELIYGLPMETKESFLDVIDLCFAKDITTTYYSLAVYPGAELHRPSYREKYGLATKYRKTNFAGFSFINDEFISEGEEIVVATNTASLDDFYDIRRVGFLFYVMNYAGYFRQILRYIVDNGIRATDVFSAFFDSESGLICEAHAKFIKDYDDCIKQELFDSPEELASEMERSVRGGDEGSYTMPLLNPLFGARLVYEEDWFEAWFRAAFEERFAGDVIFFDIVNISSIEWLDHNAPESTPFLQIAGKTAQHLGVTGSVENDDVWRVKYAKNEEQVNILSSFKEHYRDEQFSYYNMWTMLSDYSLMKYKDISYSKESIGDGKVTAIPVS